MCLPSFYIYLKNGSGFLFCFGFRWDIQRIREQRMFQRLQQRMNKRKVVQESEPERCTLHPNLEDGMSAVLGKN